MIILLNLHPVASQLLRFPADHPLVARVRTSNAADNTHMLRVNRQVGFAGDVATEIRQASVARLASRLSATPVDTGKPRPS